MKYAGILVFAVLICILPQGVSADQLVPVACGGDLAPVACGTCEFVQLIGNVFKFLILIASFVAVLMFMTAGFLYLTSGGNASQAQQANKLFTNVIVGYVLILAAFLIVDLIMRTLVDSSVSPSLLNWSTIECIYPNVPKPIGLNEPGLSVAGGGSCAIAAGAGGACSTANLEAAGFSAGAAAQASQICSAESSFNPAAVAKLDNIEGMPDSGYSVGLFQINLSVHELTCNGKTLDCKSAFEDTGERNAKGVKIKRLVPGKEALFQECREAAATPECNIAKAKELYTKSGDFGDWACSAKKCSINTTRNRYCPLRF